MRREEKSKRSPSRRGRTTRWTPVLRDVIRMKGSDQQGELLRFESDGAQKITRLVAPGYYLLRRP